jgi:hypothetical protein
MKRRHDNYASSRRRPQNRELQSPAEISSSLSDGFCPEARIGCFPWRDPTIRVGWSGAFTVRPQRCANPREQPSAAVNKMQMQAGTRHQVLNGGGTSPPPSAAHHSPWSREAAAARIHEREPQAPQLVGDVLAPATPAPASAVMARRCERQCHRHHRDPAQRLMHSIPNLEAEGLHVTVEPLIEHAVGIGLVSSKCANLLPRKPSMAPRICREVVTLRS